MTTRKSVRIQLDARKQLGLSDRIPPDEFTSMAANARVIVDLERYYLALPAILESLQLTTSVARALVMWLHVADFPRLTLFALEFARSLPPPLLAVTSDWSTAQRIAVVDAVERYVVAFGKPESDSNVTPDRLVAIGLISRDRKERV